MRSNRMAFLFAAIVLMAGCGGGGGGSTPVPRMLVAITVSPANPSVSQVTTQQFRATGTYSDGTTQDLTASVAWKSSNTGVATISATGLATPVGPGTTTITAASGNISGATVMTVTSATLVSIAVTPAAPNIAVGATAQFAATGTFSDNTTQDLTTQVTWSSSAPAVATISNAPGSNGLATAVGAGTATITATFGGVSGTAVLSASVSNVLSITVNGSLCSSGSYPNKPCVSVTVCTPGTPTCQTVDDILLDTGSFGLRIFSQALTVPLPQVTVGAGSLAECIQFVDGSSDWGPVQTADVILGGEPRVTVPIHVFNAAFGTVPTVCGTPDPGPVTAGFNGILGVGLFAEDCGPGCATSPGNNMYFSCNGSACSSTAVPLASQVQNPVALLPRDNNGVLVQLPGVAAGGALSATGSLILGIGTQANNTPSGVMAFPANPFTGDFITVFGGTTATSFIDSGSNGLFFSVPASLASQLPVCAAPNASWFCPAATTSFTATNVGNGGSPSGPVPFQIGNSLSLFATGNNLFAELGGPAPSGFDWGLPFFYGRHVFVGIAGRSSSLGTGPYWAY
ncbi:MAG TPA: DUF3443 family protein [Geobacteraceae bacterium]